MTERTYYRSALLLPLLAPLVAYAISPYEVISVLLVLSLIFGGIAYALIGLGFWIAIGRIASKQLFRLAMVAPLVMAAVEALAYPVLAWWTNRSASGHSPFDLRFYVSEGCTLAVVAALFGYAYVGLALAGRWTLIRARWVVLDTAL